MAFDSVYCLCHAFQWFLTYQLCVIFKHKNFYYALMKTHNVRAICVPLNILLKYFKCQMELKWWTVHFLFVIHWSPLIQSLSNLYHPLIEIQTLLMLYVSIFVHVSLYILTKGRFYTEKKWLTVNRRHQTDNHRMSRIRFPIGNRKIISVLLCACKIGGSLQRYNWYHTLFFKQLIYYIKINGFSQRNGWKKKW